MEKFIFLFVILLGAAALAAALLAYARSPRPRQGPRPVWHYLLIWPLILEKNQKTTDASDAARVLSTREIIGWLIVAALIIAAFAFKL